MVRTTDFQELQVLNPLRYNSSRSKTFLLHLKFYCTRRFTADCTKIGDSLTLCFSEAYSDNKLWQKRFVQKDDTKKGEFDEKEQAILPGNRIISRTAIVASGSFGRGERRKRCGADAEQDCSLDAIGNLHWDYRWFNLYFLGVLFIPFQSDILCNNVFTVKIVERGSQILMPRNMLCRLNSVL